MRRLLVPILLAAAIVPAAALAAPGAPGDGTVSVKNAAGKVSIVARGSFIGYCDSCKIWVNDPDPTDGAGAADHELRGQPQPDGHEDGLPRLARCASGWSAASGA